MSKALGTVWPLEPHTAKKHEILKRYFEAWLPILALTNGVVLYIDGFAGPGEYSEGEDGSPIIVLKAARDHRTKFKSELSFLFIEDKKDRYDHLVAVLDGLKPTLPANIKFRPVHNTFDAYVLDMLRKADAARKSLPPTLAFIDPFGFTHTPFSTIANLMGRPKCEVLINFMYEEINRFLQLPDYTERFDELFGTPDWRNLDLANPQTRLREIHDLYLRQLRTVAKYVRSFQMINMGNRVDYFLYFATNNLLGLERMKESMWKADPTGEFAFSDFTDASSSQLSLFATEPNYNALREMITAHYDGRDVVIGELEEWVIAETPFLKKHIRKNVLVPMEADGVFSVPNPKPKRRKGDYPPGTILRYR